MIVSQLDPAVAVDLARVLDLLHEVFDAEEDSDDD